MSQALKWKKKGSFLFYINSGNPEATLILTPDQTRLDQTSFIETFNIPVVMSQLWILLVVVAQLVVMPLFL